MTITILGCGASAGTPTVGKPLKGGDWGACDPSHPRNRRSRASILVEHQGKSLLVDTSPDLRTQLLSSGVGQIEAVLFTHDHADHTHGIDELRTLYYVSQRTKPYPVYGTPETLASIQQRFDYLFTSSRHEKNCILEAIPLQYYQPIVIGGIPVLPFKQDHGYSLSTGYRFHRVAYSTDVKRLDEEAFSVLHDLECWIVDCLSLEEKATHAHLSQTLQWIEYVKPKRAILTHMSLFLDYVTLSSMLPATVEPAFDGMQIPLILF